MNKILEQALLYDFYGELLTTHQKEVYEQFILDDLSLSEIAESAGISRQGVHDLIRRCQKALEGYENKLHLVEKFLHTLIAQTGFVPEVLPVLVRGVQAAGRLRPGPTFAKLAASTASLDALLALKADLPAYLPAGDRRSTAARAALWERICFAIWGPPGCKGGIKVIRAAPQALKPRYAVLFGP